MTEYPLLPLPTAVRSKPPKSKGFPLPEQALSSHRQKQRLGPTFRRLREVLASDQSGISLREDPSSIAPERALVFEIAGSIDDFYRLVTRCSGLEFLADEEIFFDPDDDFYEIDTRKDTEGKPRTDRQVKGHLYLAMPDVRALQELLRLWDRWSREKQLPKGYASWGGLFEKLRAVRPWGPRDRISDEAIKCWREDLELWPMARCCVEIELWFHAGTRRREIAFGSLGQTIEEAGGQILDRAVIEEIRYDGVLVELSSSQIERLVVRERIPLAICDDVMFLRPQSTLDVPAPSPVVESGQASGAAPAKNFPPIAALLDGIPVQNHRLLRGRLIVDDPDDLEALGVQSGRFHGTAMASIILHGDRNLEEEAIARKLHVHPVLYAPARGHCEETRRDRLLIDLIYRAIRRMKEGDGEGEATAPDVFLVNLSLGDPRRPFSGPTSPFARLLDYLADHYGILFFVSAGNVKEPLPVRGFSSWSSFEDATPEDRESAVLEALAENRAFRTLLSPAEALNVLTVGAQHHDAVNEGRGAMAVDPYSEPTLPNVSSAMGLGHRRVIKPDILLPGGREHLTLSSHGGTLVVRPGGRHGLRAAAPDAQGRLDQECLVGGTSVATALATRIAHLIFDALTDADGGSLHAGMDPRYYPVVIKALLVHRSVWGESAHVVEQIFGPHGKGKHQPRRDNVARLLGYGIPRTEEVVACAPHRATLLGHGIILADGLNIHRIPLPPSLERVDEPRAVTVTVAWFSPTNPRHQEYRQAKLEVDTAANLASSVGVKRLAHQPPDKSVTRGTLFHARYAGEGTEAFVDDGHIVLRIRCRQHAGRLDHYIRYGVAVTIEAGDGVRVYEQVRTRLKVPIATLTN